MALGLSRLRLNGFRDIRGSHDRIPMDSAARAVSIGERRKTPSQSGALFSDTFFPVIVAFFLAGDQPQKSSGRRLLCTQGGNHRVQGVYSTVTGRIE